MTFDRLARPYLWLERVAFGRDLERTRFAHLEALADRRNVLILGEGDGRFLARLLARHPNIRAEVLDASAAMLARATERLTPAERTRAVFRHADARDAAWPAARFDAVVTLFFLDCFTEDELTALVPRIASALTPDALWLFADFTVPPAGWRRWRARLWLAFLYGAFGVMTGLRVRRLPPSERTIEAAGFRRVDERRRQSGLLTSVLFRRTTAAPPPEALP